MKYNYLTNTPLDKAVGDYLEFLKKQGMNYKTEIIPVFDSSSRITGSAVYAKICAPHYNASAMDGIALKSEVTFGATETSPVRLKQSDFIVVDTGDPLPKDCDGVVMVEDVVYDNDEVLLYAAATPWQNVRQIGEDICAGDMILPAFSKITPSATGAMLAAGVMEVEVIKLPVVGIIPTGDEIVSPCENPNPGDIIEFNSTIFSGILNEWGAVPKTYPIVKDVKEDIISMLQKAVDECDAVILNAGSSAGREDFSTLAIDTVGEVLYHGIAIKPGKPAILGGSNGKPILGVPGYPVSGIIVLNEIFMPVMEQLLKKKLGDGEEIDAKITRTINSSLKYREFVRTAIGKGADGNYSAVPLNRGAGVVTSFVKAQGIIDVAQDCEGFEGGDMIKVKLLKKKEEINNTITITGSHDPIIDEIANLIKYDDISINVSSSHVGSMGAIMAIKRHEAKLGGIHLLDEQTGEYNVSYIKKYFDEGQTVLVKGVKRIQGIMVKPGNPNNIKDFSDLGAPGISYVNRQKGSGTRILFEFLCKKYNMDGTKIYGYEREEFTHTGVAAQIAADTADAGLGIVSAAKMYGLDFIPVYEEEYDFLIDADVIDTPEIKKFIEVLRGDKLKDRLISLGGYKE